MSVTWTRSVLYSLARFLGDYQAVKNGKDRANYLRSRPRRPSCPRQPTLEGSNAGAVVCGLGPQTDATAMTTPPSPERAQLLGA